ncbi:MAG: hypothetical protein IPJ65_27385 [Archangiaceae bacterium]|nr:hypothetical protein [Archangiaceae bacterium]
MRRAPLLVVLALACAEMKNQARLGLGGTGSAYAPGHQPDRPGAGPGVGALPSVGAAIGAAAVSRAVGGCVASCPPGTTCNPDTGLCDTLPCHGRCAADEVCQNERCVPMLLPGLNIETKAK